MSRDAARPMPIYPPEEFGRYHERLILYLECVAVDERGYPDCRRLSCNPLRHPERVAHGQSWDDRYTTELKSGRAETGHDDWDCVEDLVKAGLVLWCGTREHPRFELTDAGWERAHALRRNRAKESLRR